MLRVVSPNSNSCSFFVQVKSTSNCSAVQKQNGKTQNHLTNMNEYNCKVQNVVTSCFGRQTGSASIFLHVNDWSVPFWTLLLYLTSQETINKRQIRLTLSVRPFCCLVVLRSVGLLFDITVSNWPLKFNFDD